MSEFKMADVVMVYEESTIYDGWCVARLNNGKLVNRWAEDHPRHAAAQAYLERIREHDLTVKDQVDYT